MILGIPPTTYKIIGTSFAIIIGSLIWFIGWIFKEDSKTAYLLGKIIGASFAIITIIASWTYK